MAKLQVNSALAALVAWSSATCPAYAESPRKLTYAGFPPFSHALEGETGIGSLPLRITANATVWMNAGAWASVVGRYRIGSGEGHQFGALLGLNQTWVYPVQSPAWQELVHGSLGSTLGLEPVKILFGVYYEKSWDRLNIRLSPTLSNFAPFTGSYRWPLFNWTEAGLIGPPWLEVSYEVAPGFDLALRSNLTPLAATWRF